MNLACLKFPIALVLAFTTLCNVIAQENKFKNIMSRLDINAGFSMMDAYGAGLRYSIGQSQIGLTAHSYLPDPSWFTLSYYHHLAGESRFSDMKPWFCKAVVSYHELPVLAGGMNSFEASQKGFDSYLGLGRDFNFTKRFGLMFSIGPFFRNALTLETKGVGTATPNEDWFFFGSDLFVFYRFGSK